MTKAKSPPLGIDTLTIREDGRVFYAAARMDLPGTVFEHRDDASAVVRFFRLSLGSDGWPKVQEVTEEVTAQLQDGVIGSKRQRQQFLTDKSLWLKGQPPKPAGKRVKGSRGKRVKEADFALPSVTLLADWYRRRQITEPMLRAGNRFNNELMSAHEPCVSASDPARVKVDSSVKPKAFVDGAGSWGSQEIVLGALDACGGIKSASGSVLWHVVGLEKSIRQWHEEHNHFGLHRNAVPGLLFGALERLAKYYGFRERREEG